MTKRYGMTIDINRCVGCQTCTVACKHANDTLPEVQWRRVLDVETGKYPDVQRLFLVTGCQHCAEPPCVPVCPTGATFQREDGLVAMDYDTCIGCGYCAVACPYQARTIAHDQLWFYGETTRQEEAVEHPERIGVAQKCTFCSEKIDEAHETNRIPGLDLDVTPACSASCIAQAIQFGDFNDPKSIVSELIAAQANFQMHAELGTDPQIRYLYETPAVPGREGGPEQEPHDDPASPLAGEQQQFWDIRAAANFTFGGMGAGLITANWLIERFSGVATGVGKFSLFAGAALIAIGLFSVFMEIGRKARFLLALRRFQSSWMTREMVVVALLFPAVGLALLDDAALWRNAAGVLALLFIFCQAKILTAAKGIPAWRAQPIANLIITSGLLEGFGLLAIALSLYPPEEGSAQGVKVIRLMSLLGFILATNLGFTWRRYLRNAANDGIGPLAFAALRRMTPKVHVIGHILPSILFCTTFVAFSVPSVVYGLGGLAACIGGAIWKVGLITRAGHQQGFSLPKRPQRGSGELAAPRRAGV